MLKDNSKLLDEIIVRLPAELGEVIRKARKKTGLTQSEAAALCKVGTRFLSELENGKASIHLGKTLQVLRAFGVTVVLRKKSLAEKMETRFPNGDIP